MGQSRPLFVYFRSFLITISIQIEKSIDCVLGIRTRWPQDGRHRWNHGAMAATHEIFLSYSIIMKYVFLKSLHSLVLAMLMMLDWFAHFYYRDEQKYYQNGLLIPLWNNSGRKCSSHSRCPISGHFSFFCI